MPKRRPKIALARHHGTAIRPSTASTAPSGCARTAAAKSPCIRWLKLVVIPHVGQGIPVAK